MAKKKITHTDVEQEIVSNEVQIENNISIPIVEDPLREQVILLRAKGFDDNRIAARLMVHKHIVESIK